MTRINLGINPKAEMQRRGFKPTLEWREYPTTLMNPVTKTHIAIARPLLQERIKQRLPSNARWTNAERPDWL